MIIILENARQKLKMRHAYIEKLFGAKDLSEFAIIIHNQISCLSNVRKSMWSVAPNQTSSVYHQNTMSAAVISVVKAP